MSDAHFTLIDDGREIPVEATQIGARVRLSAASLREALGWELKPQGLCKDERCVPIAAPADLVTGDGIDLAGFAALLSRPFAQDAEARVGYLGTAAADRAAQLASLQAPDFTLPDLAGRLHSLSDFRGKKVLLVAYASW